MRLALGDTVSLQTVKEFRAPLAGATAKVIVPGVDPGTYDLTLAVGDCGSDDTIILLAGKTRHITMFGSNKINLGGPRAAVAGRLPIAGSRVTLRYDGPGSSGDGFYEIGGIVEDGAYYFDGVPAGHVFLRIYGPNYRWVEFDLGQVGFTRKSRGLVYDVTAQMLQAKARERNL